MGLQRKIRHEAEIERILGWIDTGRDPNVLPFIQAISNLSKWMGQELDYIEKYITGTRPEAASGPILTLTKPAPVGGGTTTGIIAVGRQVLSAGNNTVSLPVKMANDNYEVLPILYDGDVLIEFNPQRPTNKTTTSFKYNSPQAATLFYFCLATT